MFISQLEEAKKDFNNKAESRKGPKIPFTHGKHGGMALFVRALI